MEGGSPASYFYTRDHLGSVREITNSSGTVVARYDYDPFGKLTQTHGTVAPPFGYAGYFFHAETGLNLTYYRAYDPRIGRWLTRDPIGERGGQNLYGTVGNSPRNAVDPLGLMPAAALLVAAMGEGFSVAGAVTTGFAAVTIILVKVRDWVEDEDELEDELEDERPEKPGNQVKEVRKCVKILLICG